MRPLPCIGSTNLWCVIGSATYNLHSSSASLSLFNNQAHHSKLISVCIIITFANFVLYPTRRNTHHKNRDIGIPMRTHCYVQLQAWWYLPTPPRWRARHKHWSEWPATIASECNKCKWVQIDSDLNLSIQLKLSTLAMKWIEDLVIILRCCPNVNNVHSSAHAIQWINIFQDEILLFIWIDALNY